MQCILCQFSTVCHYFMLQLKYEFSMLFSPAAGPVTQTIAPFNHTAFWCIQAAWLILKSFTLGRSFTHRHSHIAVVFYTKALFYLHWAAQLELGTVNSILCNFYDFFFFKARTSKHLEKQCQRPQQMLKVNSATFGDYFLNGVTYSGSLLGANRASIGYSVSQYISPTRLKMWNWIWINNILQ